MSNLITLNLEESTIHTTPTALLNGKAVVSRSVVDQGDIASQLRKTILYDTDTKKYYENPTDRLVPIIAATGGSADSPTLNKFGYYTVASTRFGVPDATPMLYDYINKKYYVASDAVSSDYSTKLTAFKDNFVKARTEFDDEYKTIANPSDPHQVNSFADLTVNFLTRRNPLELITSTYDTVVGAITQDDAQFKKGLNNSIITNTFKDIKSLYFDQGIKPLVSGEYGKVFNNTLNNVSESLDAITGTSAVKAALHGQNPLDAYRTTDSKKGRANFDWDTGNVVADVALEILSDPTTYISLGAAAAGKLTAKTVTDAVVDSSKELGVTLSDSVVKSIGRRASKIFMNTSDNLTDATAIAVNKTIQKTESKNMLTYVNKLKAAGYTDAEITSIWNNADKLNRSIFNKIIENVDASKTISNYKFISSVKTMHQASQALQSVGMQGAALTSAIGIPWMAGYVAKTGLPYLVKGFNYWNTKNVDDILKTKTTGTVGLYDLVNVSDTVAKNTDIFMNMTEGIVNASDVDVALRKGVYNSVAAKEFDIMHDKLTVNSDSVTKIQEFNRYLNKISNGKANNMSEFYNYIQEVGANKYFKAEVTADFNRVYYAYNTTLEQSKLELYKSASIKAQFAEDAAKAYLRNIDGTINMQKDLLMSAQQLDYPDVQLLQDKHSAFVKHIAPISAIKKTIASCVADGTLTQNTELVLLITKATNSTADEVHNAIAVGLADVDRIVSSHPDVLTSSKLKYNDMVALAVLNRLPSSALDDAVLDYVQELKAFNNWSTTQLNTVHNSNPASVIFPSSVELPNTTSTALRNDSTLLQAITNMTDALGSRNVIDTDLVRKANEVKVPTISADKVKGMTKLWIQDELDNLASSVLDRDKAVEVDSIINSEQTPYNVIASNDLYFAITFFENRLIENTELTADDIREIIPVFEKANVTSVVEYLYSIADRLDAEMVGTNGITIKDVKELHRMYYAKLSKAATLDLFMTNKTLIKAAYDVRYNRGALGQMLNTLAPEATEDANAINTVYNALISTAIFNTLRKNVAELELSDKLKQALFDTFAGSDGVFRKILDPHTTDVTNEANRQQIIERMVDVVISKSNNYINGTDDTVGLNRKYTAVDVAANVDNIIDNYETVFKESEYAKDYMPVYFSINFADGKGNGVHSISIGTSKEDKLTLLNSAYESLYIEPTELNARYGVDVNAFNFDVKAFSNKYADNAVNGEHALLNELRKRIAKLNEIATTQLRVNSKAHKKGIIFVGYGNGITANKDSMYLNKNLSRYFKGVYACSNYVDMAELTNSVPLHFKNTDIASISKVLSAAVNECVAIDVRRSGIAQTFPNIVPDFNSDVTSSMSLLFDEINRALAGTSDSVVFRSMDVQTLNTLTEELSIVRNELHDIKLNIKTANKEAASYLFDERMIASATGNGTTNSIGRVNVSKLFNKAQIKDGYKGIMYSLKTAYNDIAVDTYFDISQLSNVPMEELNSIYKAARSIKNIRGTITNHAVLSCFDKQQYTNAINAMFKLMNSKVPGYISHLSNKIKYTDTTVDNLYAVLVYAYNNVLYYTDATEDRLYEIMSRFSTANLFSADFVKMFFNRETLISAPKYASKSEEDAVLLSKLSKEYSSLFMFEQLNKTVEPCDKVIHKLDLAIATQNAVLADNGFTGINRVRAQMYTTLVNPLRTIRDCINNIADTSQVFDTAESVIERELANVTYTKAVQRALRTITKVGDVQASVGMIAPLLLKKDDFINHLFNACKGRLVLVTDSVTLSTTDAANMLATFSNTLNECPDYVKSIKKDNMIMVYIDYKELPTGMFDELAAREPVQIEGLVDNICAAYDDLDDCYPEILEAFKQYLHTANDYLDSTYFTSSYNVLTADNLRNIDNLFDKEIQANLIPRDMFISYGLFNTAYTCNVIGDYSSAISLYDYQSTSIISNMLLGINMTKNKMDFVNDTVAWYSNPATSFKVYVDKLKLTNADNTIDFTELQKALVNNDMVLHTLRINEHTNEYKLIKIPINNANDLRKAYSDTHVCITEAGTYRTISTMLNGKNYKNKVSNTEAKMSSKILSKVYNLYMEEVRQPFIMGYLGISPTTSVANMFDAILKGVAHTSDPKVVVEYFKTSRLLNHYTQITSNMFKDLGVKANDAKHIELWFDKHTHAITFEEYNLISSCLEDDSMGMLSDLSRMYKDNAAVFRKYIPETVTKDVYVDGVLQQVEIYTPYDLLNRVAETFAKYSKYTLSDTGMLPGNRYIELRADIAKLICIDDTNISELTKAINTEQLQMLMALKQYYKESKTPMLIKVAQKVPGIKRLMDFNLTNFSKVEETIRVTLALKNMREYGDTVSQGMSKGLVSQFDYSNKGKILRGVETVLPFTTFKVYNTLFWMYEMLKSPTGLNLILNFIQGIDDEPDDDDITETVRMAIIRAKLASGEMLSDEDYTYVYKGLNPEYTRQKGYTRLGNNMLLKLSNTFMDSINHLYYLVNPIEALQSCLFSPIGTLGALLKVDAEDMPEYVANNMTSLWNLVPIFGVVAQRIINAQKQYNIPDQGIMAALGGLTGLVGVAKESSNYRERPIGYNWYNQSEDYKNTHQYVMGVSYVPAYVTKDPTAYVDTYGRLLKLGYTEEEVSAMMQSGWYMNTDYKIINHRVSLTKDEEVKDIHDKLIKVGYTEAEVTGLIDATTYVKHAYIKYPKRVYHKKTYAKKTYVNAKQFRINKRTIMTYGMTQVNRVKYTNPIRSALSTKSAYPTAYRNIRFAYRSSLYNNMYTKNGASRITMSKNAKGYTNPSIMRLHRQEQSMRVLRNRRNF